MNFTTTSISDSRCWRWNSNNSNRTLRNSIAVQELRKQTSEISNDVQALSHDLHSSKLEYLGVVEGIKSWCKEFSERQRMEIDFQMMFPASSHSKSECVYFVFFRKPYTIPSSIAG